jgi:hypothetical protein
MHSIFMQSYKSCFWVVLKTCFHSKSKTKHLQITRFHKIYGKLNVWILDFFDLNVV